MFRSALVIFLLQSFVLESLQQSFQAVRLKVVNVFICLTKLCACSGPAV